MAVPPETVDMDNVAANSQATNGLILLDRYKIHYAIAAIVIPPGREDDNRVAYYLLIPFS